MKNKRKNYYCKISVIIPAKNEAENIQRCIKAVKTQTFLPLEFIVVDNGSTDDTVQLAKNLGATVFIKPKVNVGELRNVGAKFAKGNILAFLDADCKPDKNWLLYSVSTLNKKGIGAVGSPVLPSDNENWVEKTWYFNLHCSYQNAKYINSANLIIWKEIFDKLHGFDHRLNAGEDRDLCWRIDKIGAKIFIDRRILVRHYGYPKSMTQFFRREFWHGNSIESDFRNLRKTRILFLVISNSIFYVGIIVSLLAGHISVASFFLGMCLLLSFAISAVRCHLGKGYEFILRLALLYFIYFMARTIAFFNVIFKSVRTVFSMH